MTSPQRFEQDLPALLAGTYLVGNPDYRDDLVRQIAAVRQRPAWTFPERWLLVDLVTERVPTPRVPWRTITVLALIALVIASLIAAYVGSQPRRPPPFGLAANGQIVSASGGDILVRATTDSPAKVLIGGAADDHDPQYAPDGTSLSFLRTLAGRDYLMVALADGSSIHEVIESPIQHGIFAWSPDSKSLAVINAVRGAPRLLIAQADGSGATPIDLGDLSPSEAAWRPPDGRDLLIRGTAPDGEVGLYLIHLDGSNTLIPRVEGSDSILPGGPWRRSVGRRTAPGSRTTASDSTQCIRSSYVPMSSQRMAGGTSSSRAPPTMA